MNLEQLTSFVEGSHFQGSEVLKNFRQEELKRLKEEGLHSPVLDSYKFTPVEKFITSLNLSSEQVSSSVAPLTQSESTIRFINGELDHSNLQAPGLKIKKLKDHFEEVKNLFKQSNAFSHLHHSLLENGIILEVEKNKTISPYIKVLHTLTKASVHAPTIIVVAEQNARISLLEETESTNVAYANLTETYLLAKSGAMIEHIQLDHGGVEGVTHGSVIAEIDKDATVRSFFFNTAGKLCRKNLHLNLNAPGAHGESFALFLTQGTEHSDVNTIINHFAPDTTSKQLAKGILDGESKGIFTGKIHIHPKAQRVASSQLNKNLLLSQKAQVHSCPQLEIFADDVKCSHGSTTGQLSNDELFYLKARGIPSDKAQSLLAFGFALEIVQKIDHPDLKKTFGEMIKELLETKFNLKGI